MRKALFGFLMAATAAMPIAAQAQEPDNRAERNAARAERNAERYERLGERNEARAERRQERQEVRHEDRQEARQERREARQEVRVQREERVEPVQQQQAQSWGGRRGGDGQRGERWGERNDTDREAYRQRVRETRAANRQSIDESIGGNYERQGLRNQRRVEEGLREDYGIRQRDGRRDWDRDRRDGRGWDRDRRDDRYGDRRDHRRSNWNRSWRNDSRYDWQRYRYSNRHLYRSGGYYAPYRNYRYNRLSIGIFLDSLFFSNRYWLNDPYQYRLPHAPYGTRWVRYYNDVVLVDTYSGEVLDVIHDFFW